MRWPADNIDQIHARHPGGIFMGTGILSANTFLEARQYHELTEAYVRRPGEDSYEPFSERYLDTHCEWVICGRTFELAQFPRIVGIMLAKDEADVMPAVIDGLSPALDALYYFAGDEATAQAIVDNSRPGWARAVNIHPELPHSDGLRNLLLQQARADARTDNDMRPLWVMVVQGDEIYHDDLRAHVMRAYAERATVMTCQVATFLLHESQREGRDWTQPLDKRLTHYIWDFGEHTGFLDFPWVHYVLSEHMRAHPHGTFPAVYASARPVRKHYPFRSPEQARQRLEDRLRRTAAHPHGWQPHYENYRDIFVGSAAAGRQVKAYHGWFPEAERVAGW